MPKNKSLVYAALAGGLIIVALIGVIFLTQRSAFSNLDRFPTAAYLEAPEDFLGNRYLLEAQISSQLVWTEGLGRILAVQPEGSNRRVPVFISDTIEENLHTGQRYRMQVRVQQGGLIHVDALRKF